MQVGFGSTTGCMGNRTGALMLYGLAAAIIVFAPRVGKLLSIGAIYAGLKVSQGTCPGGM
jgi:hypothetical protein